MDARLPIEQFPDEEKVAYVIVVHGMGEPRKGETVLPVINRFAEARYAELYPEDSDGKPHTSPISLGMVLGELSDDKPWMEFGSIPSKFKMSNFGVFTGATSTSGENVRFVDMFWGNITNEEFQTVGEPVDQWTKSLLMRNEMQLAQMEKAQSLVHTELHFLLRNIRTTIIPIQKVLSFRVKYLSDLIFNRFIGDVQLYAEYKTCRNNAITLFHSTMDEVHKAHERENEAREARGEKPRRAVYTVLSHSLGTVMSLDALVKARRDDTQWMDFVENFVTLGSPIDKFLMLWEENYFHADLSDSYWDGYSWTDHQPIKHFNYCDEQDPVGHRLDLMHTRTAFQKIFGEKPKEDKLYVRYPIPGKAHVDYWKDTDLFRHILNVTVDEKYPSKAHRVEWYSKANYRRVMNMSYIWPTFIFWMVLTSLCIIFGVGQTFQMNTSTGIVFHPKEMVMRTLLIMAVLGGAWLFEVPSSVLQILRLRLQKNNPNVDIDRPPSVLKFRFSISIIFLGILGTIPAFSLYMSVGFGGILLLGTILGMSWLYCRFVELVIQWRQITITLGEAVEQEMTERSQVRKMLRRQIFWSGFLSLIPLAWLFGYWTEQHFDLLSVGWKHTEVALHQYLSSNLAIVTNLMQTRTSILSDIVIGIGLNALLIFAMTSAFIYTYRAAKFFQVREEVKTLRNRAYQTMMQNGNFADFKGNQPPMPNDSGLMSVIHTAYQEKEDANNPPAP